MKFEIKNRFTGETITTINSDSWKNAVQKALKNETSLDGANLYKANLDGASLNRASLNRANLNGASLNGANLYKANLDGASLNGANLDGASLNGASLNGANLYKANLDGANLNRASLNRANLDGASLYKANLDGANLYGASLYKANLDGANLDGASLIGADLNEAKITFYKFPSIRLLSSLNLLNLPDHIALELMRRDAASHPHPERFDIWAKKDGPCPYQDEEYFWMFQQDRSVWEKGNPRMKDVDLIIAICKAKKWKIRKYLE